MNELIDAFAESTLAGNSYDLIAELGDVVIGKTLSNTLAELPIAKLFVGIGRVVHDFRTMHFFKNTAAYLQGLKEGRLTEQERENYWRALKDNPRKAEDELGRIVLLIDRYLEVDKARLLGELASNLARDRMTFHQFCELTQVIDSLFIIDFPLIRKVHHDHGVYNDVTRTYSHSRLEALGLITQDVIASEYLPVYGGSAVDPEGKKKMYSATNLLMHLCEFAPSLLRD